MGLMAIEDAKRRQQMAAQVPLQKKGWLSKKLAVTLILLLVVLNGGAVFWLYLKAKASADSLAAADNPGRFSIPGITNTGRVPTTDVEGNDIETGVTRYPSLIRTKYTANGANITVEYQTKNPATIILGYYKTELVKNNWILLYADNNKVIFMKNGQQLTLQTSTQNGVTTLTMIM